MRAIALVYPALSLALAGQLLACDQMDAEGPAPVQPRGSGVPTGALEGPLATGPSGGVELSRAAETLGAPAAERDLGSPLVLDPALNAKLSKVYTEPGEIPQLQIEHEGKKLDLPLRHTHVSAQINGFVAEVQVTQTYQNPFDAAIEAIYVFPLPENSAVDDMKMVIGDRVIQARIKRRQEARETYEAAKREGYTAALLEQERPNIFTQSVANIAPGSEIEVVVRYVQDLTYDAGEYEFVFPMVVGPRFNPGEALEGKTGEGAHPDTTEVPDASRISPPIVGGGMRTGHDISIELSLDPTLPVLDLDVPTHEVDLVEEDGAMHVSLSKADSLPNRDFVVRYRVDQPEVQAAATAYKPKAEGNGFFSLVLQPPTLDVDELVGQREIIFVVDISGSMWGSPLGLAKEAMREALGRLRPVDTFNIITFAGRTAKLSEQPVVANQTHIRDALEFMRKASAGGGTHLANAVSDALSPPVAEGRHRYVFFLTDGYVGNEAAIFAGAEDLVQGLKHRGQRARVFGMGTGSSVNRHLLDGLAKAGEGVSVYVTLREEPTRAVDRFFSMIDHPVLTDIQIDWGELDVIAEDLEPRRIPDLFASRPVIVHGRYGKGGRSTVVVRGELAGKAFEMPIEVELPDQATEGRAIETLWARTRIARFERDLWHGSDPKAEQAITDLGLDFNIVTAFTSFVAVDTSKRVSKGDPSTIVQPVEAPEGVHPGKAGAKQLLGASGGNANALAYGHGSGGMGLSGRGQGGGGYGMGSIGISGIKAKPKAIGGKGRVDTGSGAGLLNKLAKKKESGPKAVAKHGVANVSGSIDKALIRKVIRRRQGAMRAAFEKALAKDPSLGGKLVVKFTIDGSGKVTKVEVTTDTVGDAAFAKAVARIFRRMRFPAPSAGGVVVVSYPLNFSAAR